MIQITYTLVASMDDAKKLARTLVEEKLAACINIHPSIVSVYQWNQMLEESSEVALVIKSSPAIKERLMQRVKELHSYEVPAILTFEAEATSQFVDWVFDSLKR